MRINNPELSRRWIQYAAFVGALVISLSSATAIASGGGYQSNPPGIAKAFSAANFVPGGTSTLTFQITNPNAVPLTGVGFSDTFPSGLLVAAQANLMSSCGGTTNITPDNGTISLVDGTLAASISCNISVSVTSATEGIYNNLTSVVTSNEGGSSAIGAAATVTVAQAPALGEVFSALAIPAGGSAKLRFTATNPNQLIELTGVAFSDALPAGLRVSTPNGLSGNCGGGSIAAIAGSRSISLTGASLAAPGSCSFSVSVTASATGAFVNTTSAIVADQTAPGGTASAALSAGSVFAVNYAANLNAGDSIINIINTGENGAPLNGPGYGAVIGNLCVNVYAFSADEQLIDCCSCLVTPDGLAVLSIDNDLIANPATGVTPTSVVVKLLTTLAGPGGSANTCNNSAAVPGALVSGISAWSTTLHATTAPGAFSVTERSFSAATLSAGELASLTGRCSQIIGNNSGAGVCPSCFSGLFAGGADQQ